MITSVLEHLGKSTLPHVEYVGGLTIQVRGALGSLGKCCRLLGIETARDQSFDKCWPWALTHFLWSASWPCALDSSWRCKRF